MSEENKAMVHRSIEAINAGEMDIVEELFVPELAEPAKRSFTAFRSAFPDWRMEVDEVYFLRVEDGKFVDFWGLEDDLARMRQLGLIHPPEQS